MNSYRSKPGISSRDYFRRPTLSRQRQAFQEISTTSKASALVRNSIAGLLQLAKDSKTHLRFNAAMYKVLEEDTLNPVGERRVENGNVQSLNRFQFNAYAALHNLLFAANSGSINRTEGRCIWSVTSFQPKEKINAPVGASHFKLVSAGVEVDFASNVANANIADSGYLPLNNLLTGDIQLASSVTPGSNFPLLLVAGIQFYEEINGKFYVLKDKKYTPLMIMEVSAKQQ